MLMSFELCFKLRAVYRIVHVARSGRGCEARMIPKTACKVALRYLLCFVGAETPEEAARELILAVPL